MNNYNNTLKMGIGLGLEFESSIIRNISDQKQFEAPDEVDQDLQMNPHHHNTTPVEETDWMSWNHPK